MQAASGKALTSQGLKNLAVIFVSYAASQFIGGLSVGENHYSANKILEETYGRLTAALL